ncbi:uncharacterized protein LOC135815974 [Sycon ciliatum]|uniref:uncharacterized protein LOC135815974 n=1 Tax=Sycon ciliatum TaxID=27933 RepID=UPI0031F5FEE9
MASPAGPAQVPIRMYHVTNQLSQNSDGTPPTWPELRLCFPNCMNFDGDLAGLPVVCMTTTCYDTKDALPTTSPYPCKAKSGVYHHRVHVPFHLESYHLFLLTKYDSKRSEDSKDSEDSEPPGGQRQVLCLPKSEADMYLHERVLLVLLRIKYKELTAENDYKISDNESLFPVVDGTGPPRTNTKCYRANVYNYPGEKNFVNVHFVRPVSLSVVAGKNWDTVERSDAGVPAKVYTKGTTSLRECLVSWILEAAKDKALKAKRVDIMDGFRNAVYQVYTEEIPRDTPWKKWKEVIKDRLLGDKAMSSVFHDEQQEDSLAAA